jgi:hypothetical protein
MATLANREVVKRPPLDGRPGRPDQPTPRANAPREAGAFTDTVLGTNPEMDGYSGLTLDLPD